MATVPIEIVLQDAETPVDPTPTPESGEETNIVVPSTGTISNDGSSNGGIGSAVSIILPAIIAVLALGTMVALLVRRQQKRKKSNTGAEGSNAKLSKKEKLFTVTSSTIAILAATVLVGNLVIPATNAATSVTPGTAELETEDKITIIATREQDSDGVVVATVKNTSYATANLDFGYKVTTSMIEGATTANLYLDGDETSEYYIAPVSDGALADNTWGYTLEEPSEDATYLPIPLTNDPTTIVKGSGEIEDEAVDIYYAIKVDKSLPTGTYIGELEYILTDNNFPAALTTMQGMTTEICENTFTPGNQVTDPVPTVTLEDIRDHKTYTIAKLADGKCWMTQNLDLDLSTEITLTPADTNIAEDWTPANSTFTGDPRYGWKNDHNAPGSYDPGDIYYYTSDNDEDDIQYNSLEECASADRTGCTHYSTGNYYNWPASIANNDASDITEQYSKAYTSVCPAGWRLPIGPDSGNINQGEIFDAIDSYDSIIGGYSESSEGYKYLPNGFNTIRTKPLWLARSGFVTWARTSDLGHLGGYWSNTTRGDTTAFLFSFEFDNIKPATFGGRRDYYSIRCVAQ